MLVKTIAVTLSIFLVTGCATRGSNYVPVVDLKGKDTYTYNLNLRECQTYAKKRMDAKHGAVFGAILGALVATAAGGNSNNRARGAALGATYGAKNNNDTQESIIKRCLHGRGYTVLN